MAVFTPTHFQKDKETWLDTVRDYNFGTLILPSFDNENPNAVKTVRTPFFIDDDNNLTLHVSAGNNIWKPIDNRQKINIKEINNEITDEINYEIEIEGVPVVALFDGPHHYISPSWYHSEQTNPGTRVPTWNHVSVTVRGKAHIVLEKRKKIEFLDNLSKKHEKGRNPWRIDLMDEEVLHKMVNDDIEGSFKMTQNKTASDMISTSAALDRVGTDDAIATSFLIQNNSHSSPMALLRDRMRDNARSRRVVAQNININNDESKTVQTKRSFYDGILLGACLVGIPVVLLYIANKLRK